MRPVWRPLRLHSVSAWRTSTASPRSSRCLPALATARSSRVARVAPGALIAAARGASSTITVRRSRRSRLAGTWRLGSPSIAATASALPAPVASSRQLARGAQHGEAQRDPLGRRLGRVADAEAHRVLAGVERGRAGEQRGDVPVGADPEHDQVEHRQAAPRRRRRARSAPRRSGARPRRARARRRMRCTRSGATAARRQQRLGGEPVVALARPRARRSARRRTTPRTSAQLGGLGAEQLVRAPGVVPPLSARCATPRSSRRASAAGARRVRRRARRPSRRRGRWSGASLRSIACAAVSAGT